METDVSLRPGTGLNQRPGPSFTHSRHSPRAPQAPQLKDIVAKADPDFVRALHTQLFTDNAQRLFGKAKRVAQPDPSWPARRKKVGWRGVGGGGVGWRVGGVGEGWGRGGVGWGGAGGG